MFQSQPFLRSAALGLVVFAMMSSVATAQRAPATSTAAPQLTFSKDVAPILYRSCVRCHRPEEIAPMSLLTYNEVRPWAQSIKQRVSRREMPPWFVDKTIGIQKYNTVSALTHVVLAPIV